MILEKLIFANKNQLKSKNYEANTFHIHQFSVLHGGMAQETQIQLYKENVDDWVKDDRSLPIMPTATHDGNIISIYSDMPIEKLEIAIKDTYKNIIHSAIIIGYSKCHTFELPRLPKGKYTIELTIGEESFYGHF